VGISSVAGDRSRASNYVYGSAKAGFTAFLSGQRNRLAGTGIHVITVKPGFVNTRMTEATDLPGLLTSSPGAVAGAVAKAITKKRDIVYIAPVWRLIMLIIRVIPERI
jgi:decaprenylphospho-beta-D-erythro-pentofuranosid-2-ulose 2-reductase